ncbi:MAG: BspA family leucine-rich repeat surface protein [Cyclobacteriaceae bacterium]|nr:BspA family leucine-rich repeat surface protein [Cyclobacteriaceae bacterium]
MAFRFALKYSRFIVIVLLALTGSSVAYSQTVEAADLGASNVDIYKLNKQRVYGFRINATGGNATLEGLTTQATGNTYTSADILNFELYFNNVDDFNSATLVGTSGASMGGGETINFGSFSQIIPGDGLNRYFYIAANVAPGATTGNVFSIPILTNSNFTWTTAVSFTPSLGASGTKVIQDQSPFITTWKTDNSGKTTDTQIEIPTTGAGYNYNVLWVEVGNPTHTGTLLNQTGNVIIDFGSPGIYRLEITGNFPRIFFNKSSFFVSKDAYKILTVEQWGNNPWTSMASAFEGCSNLRITATDSPNLSGATNMSKMFRKATALNDNINHWDVSTITNMSALFDDANSFDQPLDNWDVSNVTNMSQMFYFAGTFNQNISSWVVNNVKNMSAMFTGASVFNQDISGWNTGQVTTLSAMFSFANDFNQDIGGWNTANVTDMSGLFQGARAFNQNISGWNLTNVNSMSHMFSEAIAFDQPITNWDVSNVKDMSFMFNKHPTFNQDISGWTVDNVTNMSSMFDRAFAFNQDISGWNVGNVTNMSGMFNGTTSFNQDISIWDVSKVTNMGAMFLNATAFDQDLNGWIISSLSTAYSMFDNSGLSVAHYDNLLEGWASQSLKNYVYFGASGLYYCAGETARAYLISNFNWNITDAGQGCLTAFYGVDTTAPEIINGQASAVDFGSIDKLPSTKPRSFTIVNKQDIPITNVVVAITGTAFSTSPSPFTIAAETSYTFSVDLSNLTPDSFTENLSITSDNFPGTFTFPVSGVVTATPEPEIVVYNVVMGDQIYHGDTYGLDFYSEYRGNNPTRQITIFNNGAGNLNITNVVLSGTAYSLSSTPPTVIAPDNSETIEIILSGTVAGLFDETLRIVNNDTDEGNFEFGIFGEIYGPEISVFDGLDRYSDPEILNGQSTAIDFGAGMQGTDITRTLTIANFGMVDMDISNLSITGSAYSTTFSAPQIIIGSNDGIISTLTFDVTLSGLAGGTFNETITIASDDDSDPLFVFPVTGIIVGGPCTTPTAASPSIQSNVGQPFNVDVVSTANGNAGDTFTVTILQNPTKGTVTIKTNMSIDYVANIGTLGGDSFQYKICNQCSLCSEGTVSVDVLNEAPVFTSPVTPPSVVPGKVITLLITDYINDLNDNLDLASLTNLTTTGNATISYDGNGVITLDYSNATFSGSNASISFRIYDTSMAFTDVTIAINVAGEIIAFNGISPNNDGKNDHFHIENIQFLEPNNSVTIYNRWGDLVFEIDNYNPELSDRRFEGRQNNGKKLPSGVYFYKVDFESGRASLNGYLTLKK